MRFRAKHLPSKLLAPVLAAGCLLLLQTPAFAYYYGLNYGYNLLAPGGILSRALYPGYAARNLAANPYWLINSAVGTAAYAGQTIAARRNARTYSPDAYISARPANNVGGQTQMVQDQVVSARWATPRSATSVLPEEFPDYDPAFMPVPAHIDQSGTATGAPATLEPHIPTRHADTAPPVAPAFAPALATVPATSAPGALSGQPLASAFIDHVNDKYQGHIGKALKDKSTRSCASALGLIGENDNIKLSHDQLETVRKVLSDPNEDAVTKITTVRMLLKHQ